MADDEKQDWPRTVSSPLPAGRHSGEPAADGGDPADISNGSDTGENKNDGKNSSADVEAAAAANATVQPPRYSVFTTWQKRSIVLAASLSALFSPLTGQIYLPALNVLASDFAVTAGQINLTVTTYMVFQGVTPALVGSLADAIGRRPAYLLCFVIYIVANVLLAEAQSFGALLALRCLQSAGSSSTVALCQAVVADIITSAERGQYMALTVMPAVLGPSVGPLLGGVLAQSLGWRSIFWFLAIAAGVVFVPMLLFFPETCRVVVGDGSIVPHAFHRTFYQLITESVHRRRASRSGSGSGAGAGSSEKDQQQQPPSRLRFKTPNLLHSVTLLFQKEIGLLLLVSSVLFAAFYAVATAMPSRLASAYGFDDLRIGLMYLPTAGGSILSALFMGRLVNWNFRRHAALAGVPVDKARQQDLTDFPIERARLEIAVPLTLFTAVSLIGWGWAFARTAHVAVLCVLLFFIGAGIIGTQNCANVLLIDVSPGRAGAAIAANNLSRCLIGAALTAAIVPMIDAMGYGWAFVLIGLLCAACAPVLMLIMARGIRWRRQLKEQDDRKQEKKEEKKRRRKALKDGSDDVAVVMAPDAEDDDDDAGQPAAKGEPQGKGPVVG